MSRGSDRGPGWAALRTVVSNATMTRRVIACAALAGLTACGPHRVAVDPSIAARATLARAGANVRAGCFDCLIEALSQYESVRGVPAVSRDATAGAVRASSLLALRERELGMTDSGYLERARSLAATTPEVQSAAEPLLAIIDAMPWRVGAGRSNRPDAPLAIYTNREARAAELRASADRDELSAYTWIAYACQSGVARSMTDADLSAAIPSFAATTLIRYALATVCGTARPGALDDIVSAEPRFKEIAFHQGLAAIGARRLDDADTKYREAYAWRETWPAVTLAVADVAMTGEDFATALEFYQRTLTLAPLDPQALLGALRALSYLDRYQDALDVADQLLAIQRYPGDARYWRAYNELSMRRYDDAWTDIELADRSLVNSDVPKLAGIIAIDRKDLDVARQKLELSQQRNANDCQTGYYLHLVLTEQRTWERAAAVAQGAGLCFDLEIKLTRDEVARLQASDAAEARKARLVAAREQRISADTRMRANCWYNAAVASYNLSKPDDAREFASRLIDDEQFGDRARQILQRLTRPGR